jgi:hypothetical protein
MIDQCCPIINLPSETPRLRLPSEHIFRGFSEVRDAVGRTLQESDRPQTALHHIIVTDTIAERSDTIAHCSSRFTTRGVLALPYEATADWQQEFRDLAHRLLDAGSNVAIVTNNPGLPSLALLQEAAEKTGNRTRNFVLTCYGEGRTTRKAKSLGIDRGSYLHIPAGLDQETRSLDRLDLALSSNHPYSSPLLV